MRARNIKPGFFKNEKLADLPFEARLLFIGLWGMADREGRLEDRPKRIKAEIFPYDHINIEKLLDVITCNGFTLHYDVNGNRYIQIINFLKHQNAHPHEAKSIIPPMSLQAAKCHLPAGLNPDVRNPSSLNPESLSPYSPPWGAKDKVGEWFEKTWMAYPKESRLGKKQALRHYKRDVKGLEDAKAVAVALEAYLKSKRVKDGFIQNASTWFNNWRDWNDDDNRRSGTGFPSDEYPGRRPRRDPSSRGFVKAERILNVAPNSQETQNKDESRNHREEIRSDEGGLGRVQSESALETTTD